MSIKPELARIAALPLREVLTEIIDSPELLSDSYYKELGDAYRARAIDVLVTHRVVPVELLQAYQTAIEAGQFMGFDDEYNQMQTIIEGKTA